VGNWGTVVVGVMTIGIWGEGRGRYYLRILKSLSGGAQNFYCVTAYRYLDRFGSVISACPLEA